MNQTGKYIASKSNLLSIYMTCGYPELNNTSETILALQHAGADLIEVGIPYSDPLADGPVIQASSKEALDNGFSVDGLFKDLHSIKTRINIPLVPMGYFNTVLKYGIERFLDQCVSLNIDTVILPDLPLDLYEKNYAQVFRSKGVHPVFLISPKTPDERIRKIDTLTDAFIYIVADNSITGAKGDMSDAQIAYFQRIANMNLKNPTLIGFGIADNKSFTNACKHANGAIIGSAFIKAIGEKGRIDEKVHQFVSGIRG
ncbi:tryptophan synthase subunit alpha [Bacteroidota bacterium]